MAWFSPISQIKILVPHRRKELISRPRLLNLLDDLLDFKLIIIAAPAGYGKTSLMIDYASSYDWPIAWLALDQLDRNPARFYSYFIAAIQQRFPAFGEKSIAAMRSMRDDEINLDYLVTTLTNDIYDNITEHFIFVLDDYHLINQGTQIDEFLSSFLQKVSENFHLVVTSRTLLSLPDLPLLVARSQVGGLSLEELVFRSDEIKKLFAKNNHIQLSDEEAKQFALESEGWVTGLLLTSQMSSKGIGAKNKISRASGIGLYEYLAQQVLDQQEVEIQEFLMWSSLIEEFSPYMCKTIIGEALNIERNWHALMEEIIFNNLFVVSVGEDGFWLRYHHLFRDFLQHRMENTFPKETNLIRHKLADYYTNSEDWERVFNIYSTLGDVDEIISLLEKIGSNFIARGKNKQLEDWFTYIPQNRVMENAKLLSLQASVEVNKGNLIKGLELLNTVISIQDEKNTEKLVSAENLVRRSTTYRLLGNYQESLQDAEQALQICKSSRKKSSVRAEAMRALGINHFQQGHLDQALTLIKKSFNLYTELGSEEDCARILVELGAIYETLGQFDAAEKAYHQSLQYWKHAGDSIWQSTLYNNLGVLQHAKGDYEKSFTSLEKAMSHAHISGNLRMEGYSLASIGDLYKDLDAYNESLDAYSKAGDIAQNIEDQFLVLYTRLAQTRIKTLQHQLNHADTLLDSAYSLAKKSGSELQLQQCKLEKAILKYAKEEYQNSLDLLHEVHSFFKSNSSSDTVLVIEMYLVLANAKLNKIEEATKLSQSVLCQVKENPNNATTFSSIFLEVNDKLKPFMRIAKLSKYIEELMVINTGWYKKIQNVRRKIRKHASVIPFADPKLIIRGFGKTEVILNNKTLTTSDWMTQTSRDLFFYFLSNPEGKTKEEVGVDFWPDSSTEELKRRFKNAIYRMRRAIGSDAVIFNDNFYRFNNTLDFEYDVLTFEQLIAQAEQEKDINKRIKLYQSATALYKGPFLADIDIPGFDIDRQRYFSSYITALKKIYDLYVRKNQFDDALEITKAIIENEPFSEDSYRNAMYIYQQQGNTAAIIRTYELCKQQLKQEYGVEPSEETTQYFQALIQST